jgi:hypothetical protein
LTSQHQSGAAVLVAGSSHHVGTGILEHVRGAWRDRMTRSFSVVRALLVAVLALPLGLFLAGPAQAVTYECTPMASDTCRLLQPIAECVWDNLDGTKTALWGWDNPTTDTAHIPGSNKNNMSPGAEDQGQPTLFGPGRQSNIFTTTFVGTSASWHLGNNDALVDASTPACSTKPVSQVGDMRALALSILLIAGTCITVLLVRNRRHEVTA